MVFARYERRDTNNGLWEIRTTRYEIRFLGDTNNEIRDTVFSMEALEKIKQVEAEGRKLLEDAERKAPARCRETQLEVEKKLKDAESGIKEEIGKLSKKSQGEVEEEIHRMSVEFEKEKEEIKKLSSKNREIAVKFIKEKTL